MDVVFDSRYIEGELLSNHQHFSEQMMSELHDLYKKLGNDRYGEAIGDIAPYFSTIHPTFITLRPGYCEIIIKNQKCVHNHIGTVHAIAICNGAELCAGVTTDISIPDEHRWIPVGMSVEYLAKAKTDIRVVANGEEIDWSTIGDIVIPVDAYDTNHQKVLTGKITMRVAPKK